MNSTAQIERIFNFGHADVVEHPYPHIATESFFEPEFYWRLEAEFPEDGYFDRRSPGGRTGRDLYSADPQFASFLSQAPAWRELHALINSPSFIRFAMDTFGPHMDSFGCRVSPEQARFSEYVEDRTHLVGKTRLSQLLGAARSVLRGGEDESMVNDLYVRFDVEQGGVGYSKPVHCDIKNRVASVVVYFCDADEIGLEGGDLRIHEHLESKEMGDYERHPDEKRTRVVRTLRTRHNCGAFFLCPNNSYHSVTPITAVNGYRRFIYLNVSSRAQRIW